MKNSGLILFVRRVYNYSDIFVPYSDHSLLDLIDHFELLPLISAREALLICQTYELLSFGQLWRTKVLLRSLEITVVSPSNIDSRIILKYPINEERKRKREKERERERERERGPLIDR